MAKSKAQRMKEYRARKIEKLGEDWYKRERERVKGYFKPTELLTDEQKEYRRAANRKNSKRFYDNHKKNNDGDEKECEVADNIASGSNTVYQGGSNREICSEDDNGVSSTVSSENVLTVKMPFQTLATFSSSKRGTKKRQSRALKRSYARIETLEDQNETLKRKLKTAQKRIERFESTKTKKDTTPRSKTDSLLKKAGIRPTEVPEVRKQLIYAECITQEIKKTMAENPKEINHLQTIIGGKVIKKYRLRKYFQLMTDVDRRKVMNNKRDNRRSIRAKAEKIRGDVHEFLVRDDNSRIMPGKGDSVKVGREKKQKRILNDYLHNLHLKFISETDYKISKSSFYRPRPKELTLVNFASRSICLCAKHQNMSFKLRSLKGMNVCSCTSPDVFVDMYKNQPEQLDIVLAKISHVKVKFQQWKRVKLQNGKERMRIVDVEMTREDFVNTVKKEFTEFVSHVDRVKKQYKSVKSMKENLPRNHMLIQMDFSENYNCQTVEEIQSAYWNASMVTLHPTIVYFNGNDGTLCHKSMVFVSEVLSHNASMVSAIITKTIQIAKQLVPDLEFVHFWTDSPSSQYRNRSIFDLVCNFERLHGCKSSWHYFESGHGKSACDGVGGTAKRNADMAVKQSKAVIQDAHDFYAWAEANQSEIQYHLITQEEYDRSNEYIEKRKREIKPVKGTMSVHAVASDGRDNLLLMRDTTCACHNCFGEKGFNSESSCNWRAVTMKVDEPKDMDRVSINVAPADVETGSSGQGKIKANVNDFVVAEYDGKCYIGQVFEVDENDETYFIKFMTDSGKAVKRFKWPSKLDRIWVESGEVLRKIDAPTATGKSGRIFAVPDDILMFMEERN